VSGSETRSFGATLALVADALFLGALLFIHVSIRRGSGAWPDIGVRPPAALPLLSAAAAILAAALLWLRAHPIAPLLALVAAIELIAWALHETAKSGAAFGAGRYGTIVFALSLIWAAHLAGLAAALGLRLARGGVHSGTTCRFAALQACFGVLLATLVFLW